MEGLPGRASVGRERLGRCLLRGTVCALSFRHVANEAEALARNCAEQLLLLAIVTDGLAYRIDVAGERRFRDDATGPHGLEQMILADDAVTILQQIEQQVEDLRAYGDGVRGAGELAPIRVEDAICE